MSLKVKQAVKLKKNCFKISFIFDYASEESKGNLQKEMTLFRFEAAAAS
jgi:hypothetical protein